ncbi:hypothetical protein TGAM01_v203770 [Trichoderma gamsii]|uniref:Uncharacterized protein n=1 Tax=Trichoderma gamsii TaxID=398673 RepID=A0A2P4ZSX0_9HYPO|nr:hypothetical protein TGAM01_v203770 [Trichoderma gamsii]PON27389.1 hypothetical protein TGAM01_v203770 [Trichoderma gamsii]
MAPQAPFEVYFNQESNIVLHSRRKLSYPSGIPLSATCTNVAFEVDPIDLQSVDTAEWVDVLQSSGSLDVLDIDTLTALNINHVITDNKYWFVDTQLKRSQRATEDAAPDIKEFYLGTEHFIEVRTPDELEPKDSNFPPIASVFTLVTS